MQRLEDENEVIKIVRQDKEEVLFYNNSDYEICVDEGMHTSPWTYPSGTWHALPPHLTCIANLLISP